MELREIIALAIGVIIIVVGIYKFISHKNKRKLYTLPVNAEVVDIVVETYCDQFFDVPIFRFPNSDGQEVTVKSKKATKPCPYSKGDRVELLFRPDNRNDIYDFICKLDNSEQFLDIAFIVAGIAFAVIGGFIF